MNNRNQTTIDGLRAMADWIEQHPRLPKLEAHITEGVYDKETLLRWVAELGAFQKQWDDSYLNLVKTFSPSVRLTVYINRERICSKRVVWDCPDEGLLELAKEMTETKA